MSDNEAYLNAASPIRASGPLITRGSPRWRTTADSLSVELRSDKQQQLDFAIVVRGALGPDSSPAYLFVFQTQVKDKDLAVI